MGGKGGGGVSVPQNPYEAQMAAIARQYWAETAGLRQGVLGDLGTFVQGGGRQLSPVATPLTSAQQPFMGSLFSPKVTTPAATTTTATGMGFPTTEKYDPYALPAYKPLYNLARTGIESQYDVAKQNIMGTTPRGGQLTSALTGLETSRAAQAGALPAQIGANLTQDLYSKAYAAATGSPGTAGGLLGGAASSFGQSSSLATAAQLQQQQMANQMWGGIGQGVGTLAATIPFLLT